MVKQDMVDFEIFYPKFFKLFQGRENVIAQQADDGAYYPLRDINFDTNFLYNHLSGLVTVGQYVLDENNECNYLCIDLDIAKDKLDKYNFKDFNLKIKYLGEDLIDYINYFLHVLKLSFENLLFEDSGGKGLHIWLFFDASISAIELRKLDLLIKKAIQPKNTNYEFFPKQAKAKNLGNCIKLPLGIHKKYKRRSLFFKYEDDKFNLIKGIEDNLKHLQSITQVSKDLILKHVSSVTIEQDINITEPTNAQSNFKRLIFIGEPSDLINKCQALNLIHDKAISGNVLNRKEVFAYTSSLLCFDKSENFIKATLSRSFGTKYSEEYTSKEIGLIKQLKPISCYSLKKYNICKKYCTQDIIKEFRDNSIQSKIPASVFFNTQKQELETNEINLKDKITDEKNIELAFIKLKKYGPQGTLFHDFFEFQDFEENLHINCKNISELFKQNETIPLDGYVKFNYPKKISTDQNIEYRKLAYSSVLDQVVIQSVFNYVGVILDSQLSDSSIGYRIDKSALSDDIFEDWHELYPIYREKIINCISDNKAKYFIYSDIEQFYDRVKHELLLAQIKSSVDDFSFKIIKQHINGYHFNSDKKGYGLPQGPAFARVLANFYLVHFDQLCDDISDYYFRYVDDMFIFFSSEDKAKTGLEQLTAFISNNLGLSFSSSEDKEVFIRETSKNRKLILEKFHRAWYLEKNEFRRLEGSTVKTIQAFYNKIDQKIKVEIEDIMILNKELSSFIYLSSDYFYYDITSELRSLVIKSIPYLINRKQFFPKNAKQVFNWVFKGRLFSCDELFELYKSMDYTHKIIFLFELEIFTTDDKHYEETLNKVLHFSINIEYPYLKGIAIAILHKKDTLNISAINFELKDINNDFFIRKLPERVDILTKIREYYNTISYNNLSITSKKRILNILSKNINKGLQYTDSIQFTEIVKNSNHLYLPEICEILIRIKDNNTLWGQILKLLADENQRFKAFIVFLLEDISLSVYKNETDFVLQNQIRLYKEIEDDEIRDILINTIGKLISFDQTYIKLYDYRNADYYQTKNPFVTVEVLNWSTISKTVDYNIEELIDFIEDISSKGLLPRVKCNYHSTRNTLTVEYHLEKHRYFLYKETNDLNEKNILKLIVELFDNSRYIFKLFKRCPLISEDNILYDRFNKAFVFKTIGSLFNQSHIIYDKSYDIIIYKNIPRMLGSLLKSTFFRNADSSSIQPSYRLFLSYLKTRLQSEDPISFSRISFLSRQIESINIKSEKEVIELYLFERFKAQLLLNIDEKKRWYGIVKAYMNIIDIAKKAVKIEPYVGSIYSFHYPFSKMTILSKYLWKYLVLYEHLIKDNKKPDDYIFNLFQINNLYSILVIETICLIRLFLSNKIKKCDTLKYGIKFSNWTYDFQEEDLNSIGYLIEAESLDNVLLNNISLSNLFLAGIIRICDTKDEENYYVLSNKHKTKQYLNFISFFDILRKVEKDVIIVNYELAIQILNNQEFSTNINQNSCIDALKDSLVLSNKVRKSIPNYTRVVTTQKSYDELLLKDEDYLKLPLAKSEELYNQKNKKTIDILNERIISIVTPTSNIIEFWKLIYKFNTKKLTIPFFIFCMWLILNLLSVLYIDNLLLQLLLAIVIFPLISIVLSRLIEKLSFIQKLLKYLDF